ncbi:MAG: nitrite/sulfite reductase [Chloroflexi bacterium]|nr:nitrite/sulfite reductase [Chloroflexota bacterium]
MITTNWRTNERPGGVSFKSNHTVTTTVNTQQTYWEPDAAGARVLHVDGEEIANFEEQKERFRAGNFEETTFMRFRLRQGVYGQRQPDRQMVRIKAPFGGLTARQLEVLGEVSEKYAPLKKGHLTTRENIQFHHVPLDETAGLMRMIGDVGLTTREACGNTVRNVVAHPTAGVSKDEVFDVSPYAAAYARYFLRHPTTQNMPRKSKTAFSGSEKDEAMTPFHDMGFIARERDGKQGFKIVVGGGLSIMPQMAETLSEFVPVEDYIRHAEAALRIFNRQDEERKNLMRARIKYTIKRLGIEKFREMVAEELEGDWANKEIDLDTLLFIEDEEADAPARPSNPTAEPTADADYDLWKASSVEVQRQEGFNVVYVRVERGDIYAEQWQPLADIAREFGGGRARIDQQQNIVFRWVRTESLYDVYLALKEIGMATSGRETIRDIVTCPGTDSCKLGITSSMGLNQALGEKLDALDISDPGVSKIHIKASGCPNSCGQHHVANIGFHGAVMRGGGGQVPAYELFIAGESTDGPVRVGNRVRARVPAKRAPEALEMIIDHYKANRNEGEEFNAFVDRVGTKPYEDMFGPWKAEVGGMELGRENINTYMDWGKTVLYKLERGEGECAV